MFPANVYAALEGVPLGDDPATPLWFRIPEQVLFVAVAPWACARPAADRPGVREGVDR